jgi:hypothetical protein
MAHILQELSQTLDTFWQRFGGKKNSGVGRSSQEKLLALWELAQKRFKYKAGEPRSSIRGKFDLYKQSKRNPRHSLKSRPYCFVCLNRGSQRHHIITISNGGKNWKRNLVTLCSGCHTRVHGKRRPAIAACVYCQI